MELDLLTNSEEPAQRALPGTDGVIATARSPPLWNPYALLRLGSRIAQETQQPTSPQLPPSSDCHPECRQGEMSWSHDTHGGKTDRGSHHKFRIVCVCDSPVRLCNRSEKNVSEILMQYSKKSVQNFLPET